MSRAALCAIVFSGLPVLPCAFFQLSYKLLKAFWGMYLTFVLAILAIWSLPAVLIFLFY